MEMSPIERIAARDPQRFSFDPSGRIWGSALSAEIMLPAPEAGVGAVLRATVGFFPDQPPTVFLGVLVPVWPIALGSCELRRSLFEGPEPDRRYIQTEALRSESVQPNLHPAGVPDCNADAVLAAVRAAIVARAAPCATPERPAGPPAGSDPAPPPPDGLAVRNPSILDRPPVLDDPHRLAVPVDDTAPGAVLLCTLGVVGRDMPKASVAHLVPCSPLFVGAIGDAAPRPGLPAPCYATVAVAETALWDQPWTPRQIRSRTDLGDAIPLEERRATLRRMLLPHPGTATIGFDAAERLLGWVIHALGIGECRLRGDKIEAVQASRTPDILRKIVLHYQIRSPKPLTFGAVNDENIGVARDAPRLIAADPSAHAAMRAAAGLEAWSREPNLDPDEAAFRKKVRTAIKARKARRAMAG